jgi:TrmH family RNA methyltransferase
MGLIQIPASCRDFFCPIRERIDYFWMAGQGPGEAMISRSQISLINALKLPKYRCREEKFLAETPRVVSDLIRGGFVPYRVFATAAYRREEGAHIDSSLMVEITAGELKKISILQTPNQVLAVFEMPHPAFSPDMLTAKLTLMLDEIKDPGNLGTIIRTADWFGIEWIICSENSVDQYNPKVVQATMGSLARVKVVYADLRRMLADLGNRLEIFGSFAGGEDIFRSTLSPQGILLIGNESKGISPPLVPFVTKKIGIPGNHVPGATGRPDSLNASVATAIICSEFRRRFPGELIPVTLVENE